MVLGSQAEGQTEADLVFLLKHDLDPFTRWDAAQRLQQSLLIHLHSAATDASKVGHALCMKKAQYCLRCACARRVEAVPRWRAVRTGQSAATLCVSITHHRCRYT